MVLSTTVITGSAVPTGVRSPGTTGSVDIWHLYPDGGVDNFGNVSFSYGKRSPSTDKHYDAEPYRVYHILNNGTHRYMYGDIFDSYGK